MRKSPKTIIAAICLASIIGLSYWSGHASAHKNQPSESEQTAGPAIDTIMSAGRHCFGYSGDISEWGGWYFDTICVGHDRMLRYDSIGPSTLKLRLITKELTVDLGSDNAADEIIRFLNPIAGFKRYRNHQEIPLDSAMTDDGQKLIATGFFSFATDCVDPQIENASFINGFAGQLACKSLDVSVPPLTALYIGYNPTNASAKTFTGPTDNMPALSEYLLNLTVTDWKGIEDLPFAGSMQSDIDIRARVCNPSFVTFSRYAYNRAGLGHGMYTETFHTLDLNTGKELTNDDLFLPDALKHVEQALLEEMAADPNFLGGNPEGITADDVLDRLKNWQSDDFELGGAVEKLSFTLPAGALTDKGILFSFQPYEIDSWAAGAHHFIVPYQALQPYLTPQARNLIKTLHDSSPEN